MNDAYDEIPLPSEPVLTESETSRQLADDRIRWLRDMLVTALDNRRVLHGDSVPDMINALVKAVDDSRCEVMAVHNCWDEFTAKLVAVMPDLDRRPLFSQAEMIVAEIQRLRFKCDDQLAGR